MTFTSPLSHPVNPKTIAPEREALAQWLDYHRAELLTKLDGLDEEQAARRVLPSLNTLHGLVRHLTKVEHVWFVKVLAQRDQPAPLGGWDAHTHRRPGALRGAGPEARRLPARRRRAPGSGRPPLPPRGGAQPQDLRRDGP